MHEYYFVKPKEKNNMGEKQQTTIIIGLTTYAKKYYDTTVDIHVSMGENVNAIYRAI